MLVRLAAATATSGLKWVMAVISPRRLAAISVARLRIAAPMIAAPMITERSRPMRDTDSD